MSKRLGDVEFIREWMRFFGGQGGSRLLGWCVLSVVNMPAGVTGQRALLDYGAGTLSTRYRNMKLLRGFAEHLRAQGYQVDGESIDEVSAPARLIEMVAA